MAENALDAARWELDAKRFKTTIDGLPVGLYTLRNRSGMTVRVTNYGAKVEQILVPDRNGRIGDVALGYDSIDAVVDGQPSMGAFIGRYANRIRNARFELNAELVSLSINAGQHSLHGGTRGSRVRVFPARQLDENAVELMYVFQDGEEGYPGTLAVRVVYSVTDDNALRMEWSAAAQDRETVANFTNHTFFNLSADPATPVVDTEVTINAERFIALDETGFPAGEFRSVADSPLDFRSAKRIGAGLAVDDEQVRRANGFDHHYILNRQGADGRLDFAARAYDPVSGRQLEVWSSEPGMQFFTGNNLSGKLPVDAGKAGKAFVFRGGFCLEPSRFPDSPNHAEYPSTRIKPGEFYTGCIEYRFSVR